MSGTTTIHHYPYPTDGDLVAQVDEAIQSLAEAIDPLGVIASATVTADQTGITGEVLLTGLSVAPTMSPGRLYKVSVVLRCDSTVAADDIRATIKIDGGNRQILDNRVGTAAVGDTICGFLLTSVGAPAGAHTIAVSLQRILGTGSVASRASATNPAHLLVEDLGPI